MDLHHCLSLNSPQATDSKYWAPPLTSILIIGDSIVRNVNLAPANGKAFVLCLPGARVIHISKTLPTVFNKCKDIGTVIVHAGVNDTRDRMSNVLKDHFTTLLHSMQEQTA